ncbi:hypothetical protein HanPI659440_Chr05g0194311 [Helianthus annuus]|nr:hypothetical protein HanPI659440_Chr05g0194311 [Helianthus annuus]
MLFNIGFKTKVDLVCSVICNSICFLRIFITIVWPLFALVLLYSFLLKALSAQRFQGFVFCCLIKVRRFSILL